MPSSAWKEIEHCVIDFICILESFAHPCGNLADRVGDSDVEQGYREGNRGRRPHGAELELLSGECEGRGAIAISVIATYLGQLGDTELDHLLGCGLRALSRGDLLDDFGEHVAHEYG